MNVTAKMLGTETFDCKKMTFEEPVTADEVLSEITNAVSSQPISLSQLQRYVFDMNLLENASHFQSVQVEKPQPKGN